MTPERTGSLPAMLCMAALFVASPVVVHVVLRSRDDARVARLTARLADDVAAFRGQRRARPVLRGAPVDGNASDALVSATAGLAVLPSAPFDRLSAALARGAPAPPEAGALVARHAAALDAARAATRNAWTWWDAGAASPVGARDYRGPGRAARLLLARAAAAPPGECLRDGADAARLLGDVVPGGALVGATFAAVGLRAVPPVVLRCAAAASAEERAAAAREFEALAAGAPAVGDVLEGEVLFLGRAIQTEVGSLPRVPRSWSDALRVYWRPRAVGAWDEVAREPSRWRAFTADRYPDAALVRELDRLERALARHPELRGTPGAWRRLVAHDMTAQALLRGVALALGATDPGAGAGAPPGLDRPALRDPFSGRPFGWRRESPSRVVVWSVGPDGRDAGGAGDDVALAAR